MLAHPQERLLVEARRIDGEAHEFGGAVEILNQCPHPTGHVVAVVVERHFDRLLVQRLLEGLRLEIAAAFVEKAGEHHAEPGLVGGVLRGPAAHGEFERDERHGGRIRPARTSGRAASSPSSH